MTTPDDDRIVCRNYTHARRHPQVIGRIGGWTLPSPITPMQLAVLLGSALVLVRTRVLWARLPGTLNLVIVLGIPMALAWLTRHLRTEGRSPIRSLFGVLCYVGAPRAGTYLGRRTPRLRQSRLRASVRVRSASSDAPIRRASPEPVSPAVPVTVASLRRETGHRGA